MSLKQIREVLNNLDIAAQSKRKITIPATRVTAELVKLLQNENAVTVIAKCNKTIVLKPNPLVSRFVPLDETKSTSYKKLHDRALHFTPTITAKLIVTTSKGLMTQNGALTQRIGGIIIGAFF